MQTYRCLIVEDSEPTAMLLKEYLTGLSMFYEITICTTYAEAVSTLLRQSYDIIFLDVELNADNGLELMKVVRPLPPVVVISAHSKYAVDCYDLDVVDYLQKPFTQSRFLRSVSRALEFQVDKESVVTNNVIFLKVGRRLQKFAFDEIDYVEAYGIYAKIHHRNRMEVVNEPIIALEKRLPPRLFRRVHKSYIVNLNHVTGYNQNNFFIEEEKIPIGISYRQELPNIYNLLG